MSDQKISQLVSYTNPQDIDVVPIVDTTASQTKKISWVNLKIAFKAYFDTIYSGFAKAASTDVDAGTNDVLVVTSKSIGDSTFVPHLDPVANANKIIKSNGTIWDAADAPNGGGSGGAGIITRPGTLPVSTSGITLIDGIDTIDTGAGGGNLIPKDGIVSSLAINVASNTYDGDTIITIVKNGTPTTISITIAAGDTGVFFDTTHQVAVVAGDVITLQIDPTASSTGAMSWYFSYDYGDDTGQWQQLASITLGSPAASISATIPAFKYFRYEFTGNVANLGTLVYLQFNGDGGSNYSFTQNLSGGNINQSSIPLDSVTGSGAQVRNFYSVGEISNIGTIGKLVNLVTSELFSAGLGYSQSQMGGSWNNIIDQITTLAIFCNNSDAFATGATLNVYGHN